MDSEDKRLRHVVAGVNSSAEGISQMNYWEAKQLAADLRNYLSGDCPLSDRDATIGGVIMADKRAAELSGTDGSYDADDHAHQNQQIIEGHLEKGDLKSALQFTQMLKDKGQEVPSVKINKEATKAHYAEINKEKEKRVPVLMEELNIDKEQAEQWFDENESMDRWGRPSVLGTQEAEPEKPEAPTRPEGQMDTRPESQQ